MTQRALALDDDAAKAALDAAAKTAPPAPSPATQVMGSRAPGWSFWDRLFVVLTLGFGWLWLRRRAA